MALPPSSMSSYERYCLSSDLQWYVLHCQPLRERYTAQNLRQYLDLTVYLPEVLHASQGVLKKVPLFPRYLFIKADLNVTALSRINATEGVSRLVAFDDVPLPVPSEVIHDIHERIATLNRAGGFRAHQRKAGEAADSADEPLRELDAIFLGSVKPRARVWELIKLLGRMQHVAIDISHAARLDQGEPLHVDGMGRARYPRRTRGKKRKIHYDAQ